MESLPIVKELDIIEQIGFNFFQVKVIPPIDFFLLQLCEETLNTGVVIRTTASRHTASHLVCYQSVLVPSTRILRAAIAVEDGSFGIRIPSDRFSECSLHEFRIDFETGRITDHFAIIQV